MDVREKLEVIAHLGDHITYKEDIGICYDIALAKVIEDAYMELKNGVTVQEQDGCEYCKEDNEGYRKMIGSFSITNPFHGNVWNIETCHCKPRQIYFCPMCGRRLPQPPKGE